LQIQELLSQGYHTYSLGGVNSGIYTLKIESANFSYTAKIVSTNTTIGNTEIKHTGTIQGIDTQSSDSNTGQMKDVKSGKSVIVNMQYNFFDVLKLTGKSGIYSTVYIPIIDSISPGQTVTFDFVDCTDADSNHYAVVKIDTMIWMAENLKTTKYNNGTAINSPGTYCCYGNNCQTYNETYGKLYNWYAVNDTSGLCPTGWHIPSHDEWTILERSICTSTLCDTNFPLDTITQGWLGTTNEGGKLKEACSTLWHSPNSGATNETGFTALPGGYRYSDGTFYSINFLGFWWTNKAYNASSAWCRTLKNNDNTVYRTINSKSFSFSVRCLKD